LDTAEFSKFLEKYLKGEMLIKTQVGEMEENAKKIIGSFAKEFMQKLDVEGKGNLSWIEFKEFKTAIADQKTALLNYLYTV